MKFMSMCIECRGTQYHNTDSEPEVEPHKCPEEFILKKAMRACDEAWEKNGDRFLNKI